MYWDTLYTDRSALCGGCFGIRSGIWIARRVVDIKMKLLNAVDDMEGTVCLAGMIDCDVFLYLKGHEC